jgi:SAM-dependent methyltransferase
MVETPVSAERIMQIGMGFFASRTLLSAVELGVFTELAAGPLALEEARGRLGLHERSTRDFLDALVAMGLLDRRDGRYANAPEAAVYLDRAKPTYIGGLLEMCGHRLYGHWDRLTEGLRTGRPQNELRDGEDFFAKTYADPNGLREFLHAMTGVSLPVAQAIAAAFPWSEVRSFADVGCAQGGATVAIAAAHPHVQAIGFDLAAVGPIFADYVRARSAADPTLAERVRFVPGSFFTDPLPSADVIVMGHILHDWDLAQKRTLLKKAYEALPSGGTMLVYEAIIDDDRRANLSGLLMSLNMLIETPGGFDFTGADCIGWMTEAGFVDARVQPLPAGHGMVTARKP